MTPKEEVRRQGVLTLAHHDYDKGLSAYAFFKTNDLAVSDDLVQDTFLKTWRYLAKGGKIDIMKAFLYHVLNNLIVDEYRKRKTVSLDLLLEKGFEPGFDHVERLLDTLDGRAAALLIPRLPVIYQKVLGMRYMKGLSLKEMSLITGKSQNTMAVQVHRGVEKLRRLYLRA